MVIKCPACGNELHNGDSFHYIRIGTIIRKGYLRKDRVDMSNDIIETEREGDFYIPCKRCGDNIPEKNIKLQLNQQNIELE